MDSDGDIQAKSTAADSLNAPGTSYDFGWGEASSTSAVSGLRSVPTTMTRRQGSNTQIWTYSYDIATRRTQKVGPLGLVAEFFWSSLGLLEDVGPTTTPGSQKTLDEYVWLNGDPVVIIRAKLDPATGLHVADFDSNCWRENAPGRCQAYGVVSDRLGRPVLTLDHSTAVTGVGEYDPFGHLNRVTEHLESRHPYPARTSNTLFASTRGQVPQGLSLELRPHFNVFDLENVVGPKGTSKDFLYVLDQNGSVIGSYTGLRGDGWTNEWFAPGDGVLRLRLTTNDRNCASGFCGPGVNERSYVGFSMDAYEYRRFTSGVQPYFPPYRGPGLYYDAESDQFQNWHRQLDPGLGRYLSPEPLLQSPAYVRRMAQSAMSVPTYAYANNNPLMFVDPDGLLFRRLTARQWSVLMELRRDPFFAAAIDEMERDQNFQFLGFENDKFESETRTRGVQGQCGYSAMNTSLLDSAIRTYKRRVDLSFKGLFAHELGHSYAQYRGFQDSDQNAIDWENRANFPVVPTNWTPFYRLDHEALW